mmetsp:Transcript_22749/g.57978  ORF Transcript_22749/g.57978 Transcript_22749/m.57978 type:complete len:207 (-) Transcript_22749:342-962(-)
MSSPCVLTVCSLESTYRSCRAFVHLRQMPLRSTASMSTKPAASKSATYLSTVETVGAETTSKRPCFSSDVNSAPGLAAKSSMMKVPPGLKLSKHAFNNVVRSGMCKNTSNDMKWSKVPAGISPDCDMAMTSPTMNCTRSARPGTRWVSSWPASQMSRCNSMPVIRQPLFAAMYRAGPPMPEPMSSTCTELSKPMMSMTWSLASTPR